MICHTHESKEAALVDPTYPFVGFCTAALRPQAYPIWQSAVTLGKVG